MTRFTLATVRAAEGPAAAIVLGPDRRFLAEVAPDLAGLTCKDLLRIWDDVFPRLERLADRLASGPGRGPQDATLLTPVGDPDKLLAVGANYLDHLREMGLPVEKWDGMPYFVRPPRTRLVRPGSTVRIPRSTTRFDWECELAVFVGRRLRHAGLAEAAASVAGYAVGLTCPAGTSSRSTTNRRSISFAARRRAPWRRAARP